MKWKNIPGECPSCHHQGSLHNFIFDGDFVADGNTRFDTTVNKILEVIDKSTLLGAALDCMSEDGKDRLKSKLKNILEEH